MNNLPAWILTAGCMLLYLGERVLPEALRARVAMLSTLLIAVALGLAVIRVKATSGTKRRANVLILRSYGVCVLGLVAYAVYARRLESFEWIENESIAALLQIAWPALILLGLAPALAMEASMRAMRRTPVLELWRVRLASRSLQIVCITVITFAALNYTAFVRNRNIDLSYFKAAQPGASTLAIVNDLTVPVQFELFFPPGNEVLEALRRYIDNLVQANPLIAVNVRDHALAPEIAREWKVRSNGVMLIRAHDRSAQLRVGTTMEAARTVLRNLDAEVQANLLKVIRAPRIAYFTTGHGERNTNAMPDDTRLGIGDLKAIVEAQGFVMRPMGLGDGLAADVPNDAAMLFVLGPTEPMLDAEQKAIDRYVQRGGHLLVALDSDTGSTSEALVALLGLQVERGLVAHEAARIRIENRNESPYNIATNRVLGHASTSSLRQSNGRLWVALLGAAALKLRTDANAEHTVDWTLNAMPGSFVDRNANGRFDEATEQRDELHVAAAVQSKKSSMRAVVVSDADALADGIVRNLGNLYFVTDSLRWLAGDEKYAGVVESEMDAPLLHRKEDDTLWFYGTSFFMPALVLMTGLWIARRHSKRRLRP